MAVDIFLKIQGVDGESKDKTHGGEIDILSWSWGVSQTGSSHLGGGGGSGKADFQDLTVTKYVDKSSPTIMKQCASGKHFPEALLTVRKAGDNPVEYLKIKMKDLLISSYQTGGSEGDDRVMETISLNFAKVHSEYTPQKSDGSPDASVPFGWDIEANAPM